MKTLSGRCQTSITFFVQLQYLCQDLIYLVDHGIIRHDSLLESRVLTPAHPWGGEISPYLNPPPLSHEESQVKAEKLLLALHKITSPG